MTLGSRDLALHAARLAQDKSGADVVVLELPRSALVDYVVIVTGRSDRQVGAITDEVLRFCKQHGIGHSPAEGESGWLLLDCFDVVVHAMSEEMREFYRLERLWPSARAVDLDTELAKLPKFAAAS
ncbi:MAG: ribosome silencing factor [Planctomycetes bacterium]|nr:ribosome silencing factor [Planctomycetota bacterium]